MVFCETGPDARAFEELDGVTQRAPILALIGAYGG
jgi:hypothetical protein